MSITTDIRTIAKTDLLEEKVGRALSLAETANANVKAASNGEKSVVQQDAAGLTTPSTAGTGIAPDGSAFTLLNPGDFSTPVYNAGASSIPTIPNPGGVNTTTTNNTNPGGGYYSSGGSTTLGSGHAGGGVAGTDGGNGGAPIGGSLVNSVANNGANDSTLQALNAQMQSLGQSDEAIAAFDNAYIKAKYGENGLVTAQDIADNRPTSTQLVPAATGSPPDGFTGNGALNQKLVGIAGFDKDQTISTATGEVKSVLIRLDGTIPTPSLTDSDAAGQNPWESPNTAPILKTFTQGATWTSGSGAGVTAFTQTWGQWKAAVESANAVKIYGLDGGTSGSLVNSLSPDPNGYIIVSGNLSASIGITAGSIGGTIMTFDPSLSAKPPNTYGQVTCSGATGDQAITCALPTPYEIAWPKTGAYVVSALLGLFRSSPFDSELPLQYKIDTSSVRLALGNGTSVIDSRFMDVELGVNGGYLATTVAADGSFLSANYYNSQGGLVIPALSEDQLQYYKAR